MKQMPVLLVLLIFTALAVFGVAAMGNHEHGHSACIARTPQGVNCLQEDGPLGFAKFHLDAFRFFSTAVFTSLSGFLSFILGLALFLLAGLAVFREFVVSEFVSNLLRPEKNTPLVISEFRNWLALLQKRDPARA